VISEVTLTPKPLPKVPVEAENISPDVFAGKTVKAIKGLDVWAGNKKLKLEELFQVSAGTDRISDEPHIIIDGDVAGVKQIGSSMTRGRITINGSAGMHLASMMGGGEVVVKGSVSDWAGAEMGGGLLRVMGSAGNFLGTAYRGSSLGMNGGVIIVHGSAGDNAGKLMRRGVITVLGDVGQFAGAMMKAGTIIVFGRAGLRLGAMMSRGTIVVYGGVKELLPTFKYDVAYSPTFLRFYLRNLYVEYGLGVAKDYMDSVYDRYHGDLVSDIAKGEILIFRGRTPI